MRLVEALRKYQKVRRPHYRNCYFYVDKGVSGNEELRFHGGNENYILLMSELEADDWEQVYLCPKCGAELDTLISNGEVSVALTSCGQCGAWPF